MLGAVQFGLPYGVANRTGQPDYAQVVAIIAAAAEGGVDCIDTAAAYGTSEEIVGRALAELGLAERTTVVTKVRALTPDELDDPRAARRAIERSVDESRRRLRCDRLPLVLFHREADAAFTDELERLRDLGRVERIGVSCDNRPGPANELAASGRYAALQVPANLLDGRHRRAGLFREAAEAGVAVFVRSVYLQGLLTMPESEIPAALAEVAPVRRRVATIAAAAGLTLAELALRYLLAEPGATCLLTGVETVEQVRDNLAIFARGPLDVELRQAVDAVVPELPERIVTPALWPK